MWALVAMGAATIVGCAGADNNNPTTGTCNPPCAAGTVCDPATRICRPASNQCTGTQTWCRGVCVDTSGDSNNCGGCGNQCGFNATCTAGQCACVGTFNNCDGFWSNGCECGGGCAGRACAPPPTTGCDPNSETDCDADRYCDITAKECLPCPPGQKNCDLKSDCECVSEGCDGKQCKAPEGVCDPATKAACGDDAKLFCNEGTKECMNCGKGFLNCDRDAVCECEGLCAGEKCAECDASTVGSCAAVGTYEVYCDGSKKACKPCDAGKKNCDGKFGCECDTVCEGNVCKPEETPCDPAKAGDCGDASKYCVASSKECDNCPFGKKNCDQLGDCECEHTCEGTTCKTPCSYDDPNACDNDPAKWCYNGECKDCSPNFFNCDHTKGCECSGGCDGTQCQSACATCDGCCDKGACLSKSAQTSIKCGSGGAECQVCPLGTFCNAGQCVDCATNCPAGCCDWAGDCIPHSSQTDSSCGTGGEKCKYCDDTCYNGVCVYEV